MARILIASLVDPLTHPGGAGTYTRGLVAALRKGKTKPEVDLIGPYEPPPGSWYRWRQAISLVGSCCSKFPAKALFARRHELQARIREAVRSKHYDTVLINGSDMLWVLEELSPRTPAMLVAHNLEHRLLAQQLATYRFLTSVLQREITKQRHYELEGYCRVGGVIFVSAAEMAWSVAQVPSLRAVHVPPLFVQAPIVRTLIRGARLRLGYLADFAWWPNYRNWSWLIDEILPRVRRPVEVHVFGRQSNQLSPRDRIVIHGAVSDLTAVWNQVDFMVCPMRTGAGVSVKVAESLYNRMPVLATPEAVQGFACSTGPGLTVIDKAEAWAAFLNSPDADELATQEPSEELRRQFSIDRHVKPLEQLVAEAALDCPTGNAHSDLSMVAGTAY
ncbi:MAG: glycosyltransferase [Nitrospira sp. CR1.3]|nr:glycosyltransferase [Nitrospira sp. CR1.3]